MEAERIKFTPTLVREVGERVKRITDGAFELGGTGSDIGNGTRYIDGHQMQVWYGPTGARQACAYYTAGAMAWAREKGVELTGDDGEFLLAVQVAYTRGTGATRADRATFEEWETRGAERARSKVAAGQ
ncbi:hypothetical protein SEA_SATIS_321 [Streptomyces phage Satis]|nr:hypothetical protein SEA_SATIS_321 [Streptomyces phage Satis]QBZ72207.1 hypothetical protein SEA_KRADAL_321 [Streptomyces phage Kradal]QPL14629.1 hypothetical protein SEA_EHYELIMAYOE_324 [Streptomyces phage EhyElimayoE]